MLRDLPDDFQLDQLEDALQYVPNKVLALDIGAHRGIWTKRMLDDFERVIAVEPTDLYERIDERADVIHAACGAKSGRCSMKSGKRNTGQSHVVSGDDVEVITIDSLNVAPDFIKIDVEGMEFDVLKGGIKTILEHRPIIMIEENGLCQRYGHRPNRASDLLEEWGAVKLKTYHMRPERDVNILWGWE